MKGFDAAWLVKQQQKGLSVTDPVLKQKVDKAFMIPKKTASQSSPSKDKIEWILIGLKIPFVKEHRFHHKRRFAFDFAILEHKIAIEYNGIFSDKSRHTTVTGFSGDMTKLNLAMIEGWRVLQYTPLNVKQFGNDITTILGI